MKEKGRIGLTVEGLALKAEGITTGKFGARKGCGSRHSSILSSIAELFSCFESLIWVCVCVVGKSVGDRLTAMAIVIGTRRREENVTVRTMAGGIGPEKGVERRGIGIGIETR